MKLVAQILLCLILVTSAIQAIAKDFTLSVYEDPQGTELFPEVMQKDFLPLDSNSSNFGLSNSTYWLRIDLTETQDVLFKNCYTLLDDFRVYININDDWRESITGDRKPFSQRAIEHPCFIFDLSEATTSVIYVRAESGGLLKFQLSMEDKLTFWQQDQRSQLAFGIYFAFLLSMFIYNLLLFFIIRDISYLYYITYLGAVAVFLGSMSGHSKMYLWPEADLWADIAPVSFAAIAVAASAMFVSKLVQADRYSPRAARWIARLAILFVLVLGVNLFSVSAGIVLVGAYALIAFLLMTYVIFASAFDGYKPAYIIVFTILLMFPGTIIYYSRTVGLIGPSWFADNVLYLTTSVEAMVLSFALAYRIKLLNQDVERHQQLAITAQSKLSRSLLKAADNERRAIARELHDSFGQGLLVVKNMVNRLTQSESQQQVVQQLRGLISDTRNMARNMHPQQVETLGFSTALETMLTETITPTGLKLKLELEDVSGSIDKDAELHLYRIAQESATNIVKHASANEVSAYLTVEESKLTMRICDDGIGVQKDRDRAMGILNMTERAAIINASFEIRAREPQGTEVVVQVPI